MTPDLLRRVGEALYGERWQSALAHTLGVGDRRVREWLAGDRRVPPGILDDIRRLLRERGAAQIALADKLDRLR